MTKISISEAARRWNISRSTIHRKIQAGDISTSQLDTVKAGHPKKIDISELVRVFGEPKKQPKTGVNTMSEVSLTQDTKDSLIQHMKEENERLREHNKKLMSYIDELNRFNMEKDRKLLEHQTKPLWKKIFG